MASTEGFYTLAIIKPDAIHQANKIKLILTNNNFYILASRYGHIPKGYAEEFYQHEHETKEYSDKVQHLSSGPAEVILLAKENAVSDLLELLGPEKPSVAREQAPYSIRAKFSRGEYDFQNAMHGSENPERAVEEIKYFFPKFVVEPIKPKRLEDQPALMQTVMDALFDMSQERPEHPLLWLSTYFREKALIKIIPPEREVKPPDEEKFEAAPMDETSACSCREAFTNASTSCTTLTAIQSSTECSESPTPTECSVCEQRNCYCQDFVPQDFVVCPVCSKLLRPFLNPSCTDNKEFCNCSREEVQGSSLSVSTLGSKLEAEETEF